MSSWGRAKVARQRERRHRVVKFLRSCRKASASSTIVRSATPSAHPALHPALPVVPRPKALADRPAHRWAQLLAIASDGFYANRPSRPPRNHHALLRDTDTAGVDD